MAGLFDDEHLAGVEIGGQQFGGVRGDAEEVLTVPVIEERLQRDDHTLLQLNAWPT